MSDLSMPSQLSHKGNFKTFKILTELIRIKSFSKNTKTKKILETKAIFKDQLSLNVNSRKLTPNKELFLNNSLIWKKILQKFINMSWNLLIKNLNWPEYNLFKKPFMTDVGKFIKLEMTKVFLITQT